MDVMATDRKVWTAHETRALISLKEEMKPKFQTMKRNRPLWVELSSKLRKHFGHERTASQCAVRWKNIMSSYKDSRDALKNPSPDRKVCSFFKEVESLLGDPPLEIPGITSVAMPDHMRLEDIQAETQAAVAVHGVEADGGVMNVPTSYSASRNPRKADVVSLINEIRHSFDAQFAELRAVIHAQSRTLERLEKTFLRNESQLQQHESEVVQNGEQHERPADAHGSVFNVDAAVASHAVVASDCEGMGKGNLDSEMGTDAVEERDMQVDSQQTELDGQQTHLDDSEPMSLNAVGVGEGCTQQNDEDGNAGRDVVDGNGAGMMEDGEDSAVVEAGGTDDIQLGEGEGHEEEGNMKRPRALHIELGQ